MNEVVRNHSNNNNAAYESSAENNHSPNGKQKYSEEFLHVCKVLNIDHLQLQPR